MDIDSVADELYGLPPGEFTATRNERAKQARADGNRELAEEIKRLDKPTTSAWLVNQVARELADQLTPLIDLGRDLREATSNISGEELRTLTRQRHELVHALVQQARKLASEHGTKVSDTVAAEVQQTLDASLADPAVAEAVLSGRLTQAAEYAGFGQPMGADWARPSRRTESRRRAAREPATKVTDLATRRREAAERALAEAEERLQTARAEQKSMEAEHEQARSERQSAEQRVERLRAELDDARDRARDAGHAERTARDRLKGAERALAHAEDARQEAADHLTRLPD